jgi:threonine/homoserine efflux transporter RhtA
MPVPNHPYDYDPTLNGVGGWLVLVIIGRILTIIVGIRDIVDLSPVIGTVPSLDYLWILAIILDITVYIILSIVILVFMFSRKIIFRLLFVIQVAVVFFFSLWANITVYNLGYDVDPSGIFSSVAAGVVWIIYLYKSKRVKNTYIYPYMDFEEGEPTF